MMMRKVFIACLLLFLQPSASTVFAQVYDTVDILFPLNDPKLSKDATAYIDSLIFHDVLIHGQKFTVLGYTDYLGDKVHNEALSKARANNVMDYLVTMGFETKDISLCIGKGKIERAAVKGRDGIASDRKVQLVIDGNPTKPTVTVAPPPAPIPASTAKHTPAKPATPASTTTKIDLTSIKLNEAINLKNLLFYGDRHDVLPESKAELENLYHLMKENNMVKIQIEGHICCLDPADGKDKKDEDNSGWLSETRAKAIFDYLVGRGIDSNRMRHKGFGNTKPLAYPEITEDQKRQNRRVEIRILGK